MASLLQLPDVEAMSAEEVLRWAYAQFGERLCLTCSWQKQSSVLVHMVAELDLDIPVIELDTGLFFRETYDTREVLVRRYGLELIHPEVLSVAEQHRQEGPNLWERDPDRCCHVRKVEPLERALAGYDAWISGIRREQSLTRQDAQRVEWSERYRVWKVQPLVDWNTKRVDAYIHVNEIPYNPLHDAGYPSIGCMPCTRPVSRDEDERAGRWADSDKIECGIHDRLGDREILSAERTSGGGSGEPGGSPAAGVPFAQRTSGGGSGEPGGSPALSEPSAHA